MTFLREKRCENVKICTWKCDFFSGESQIMQSCEHVINVFTFNCRVKLLCSDCFLSVWHVRSAAVFSAVSAPFSCSSSSSSGRQSRHDSLIDLRLLCRRPRDRPRSPLTGRSPTLYIQDCCWQGCSVQPDLDGRSPYLRDISFLPQCPAASPPTGWLWTDHRASVGNTGRSAIFTDRRGNVGRSTAAAPVQDLWDLWGASIPPQTPGSLGRSSTENLQEMLLWVCALPGDTHSEESI